jgi:hypothetical protein
VTRLGFESVEVLEGQQPFREEKIAGVRSDLYARGKNNARVERKKGAEHNSGLFGARRTAEYGCAVLCPGGMPPPCC